MSKEKGTRYLVTRSGVQGLEKGAYIYREKLHPSLVAHVTEAPEEKEKPELEVGKPLNAAEKKAIIGKRLDELGVPYASNLGVDKMIALLPDGEAAAMGLTA